MATPFFSIILPVYNGEKFIAATIESVLQQSFTNWELIVVDDGSVDGTAAIVTAYCAANSQIKLLHQSNQKQPAAHNTGIATATGAWVAFIDADDVWLPAKLKRQYDTIVQNPLLDVIYTDGYTRYHDKLIRHYYHYEVALGFFEGRELYKKMLFGNFIPILSAVVKMEWVKKVGKQDEAVAGVEDHDYWLRLCRAGARFYGMEERLFEYRVHGQNFSANLVNQHHLSLLIRMNNYDPQLVPAHEAKQFTKSFKNYIRYFKQQGRADLLDNLQQRYAQLNIPPVPLSEQWRDQFHHFRVNAKTRVKSGIKQLLYRLATVFYFHPKKWLFKYRNKLAVNYVYWLNFRHVVNHRAIKMSATATVNFYNVSGSCFDTQGLYLGDFSRINFMENKSQMITGASVTIGKYCNFNIVGQLVIGNNVLFNNHTTLTCHSNIVVGDDTWFGEGVRLYDHNHNYKNRDIPFTQQGYTNGKIIVGNNVWVGSNVIILNNVTIGDGCVIGANNVIYKSLPPNTMVKSRAMEGMEIIKPS